MKPFERERLASEVVAALDELKAVDLRTYDLTGRSIVADTVVLATGEAGRHVEAMADMLRIRGKHLPRHAVEGQGECGWVLVDLGDVVVHLMTADRRDFYGLDEIYTQLTAGARGAR